MFTTEREFFKTVLFPLFIRLALAAFVTGLAIAFTLSALITENDTLYVGMIGSIVIWMISLFGLYRFFKKYGQQVKHMKNQ